MANQVSFEVVNFEKEMKRVEAEIKRLAGIDLEEKVDYATDTLRVVTPVDTGEARAGWETEKTKDKHGFVEALILNPVEHISALNNGHSRQAPRYFIEQVLTKIGILTPD